MKVLHLTSSPGWFEDHFKQLCLQLGMQGETQTLLYWDVTAKVSNEIWEKHKEYYESFDAIFISHLANLSRIFLQNDWKKPLYVWFFFRFDFCSSDLEDYYALLREAVNRPNVKFFASSEIDVRYTRDLLGFTLDIVEPLIFATGGKVTIPIKENELFLVNKCNESYDWVKDGIARSKIPVYRHVHKDGAPDLSNVRGILHVPYYHQCRSFYENLALETVYFLPEYGLFSSMPIWWDWAGTLDSTAPISDWYREENQKIFIYFWSFPHLKRILDSPSCSELIAERKQNIREYNKRHNEEALMKWKEVFKEIL
jgi:hypothetical protein